MVTDRKTGLSIRFIREWKPENEKFSNMLEWTFPHKHVPLADGYCGICGYRLFDPLASVSGTSQNQT